MRSTCVKNHINEVHTKWDAIRRMPISQVSPQMSPQMSQNSPQISVGGSPWHPAYLPQMSQNSVS